MSYDRIGNLAIVKNGYILANLKNYYAVYELNSHTRNAYRHYTDLKCVYLNTNYINKNSNLFKLSQDAESTLHKENGYFLYVNILTAYFNPRYAHFRKYIQARVFNKTVLVLGDGVGPFSIYLGKTQNYVVGYDFNPDCIKYALINKRINKIMTYWPNFKDLSDLSLVMKYDIVISVMPTQIMAYSAILRKYIKYKIHYSLLLHTTQWYYPLMYFAKLIQATYTIELLKKYTAKEAIALVKFQYVETLPIF